MAPRGRRSSKKNATRGECVLGLSSNDVLLGRGSGPNVHNGNIRFRELVCQRKKEYMSTKNRHTKVTIATDIVNQVIQKGGRFLKKLDAMDAAMELPKILKRLGIRNKQDVKDDDEDDIAFYNHLHTLRAVYEIQDKETALEKAKQALRQSHYLQNSCSEEAPEVEEEDGSQLPKTTTVEQSPSLSTNETDVLIPTSSESQSNTPQQRLIGGGGITTAADNQDFNDWKNNRTLPMRFNELSNSNDNDNNMISPDDDCDPTANDKDDKEVLPIVNDDVSPIPMAPPLFSSHDLQQPQQQDNAYNQLMTQKHHSNPLTMSSFAEQQQPLPFMVGPVQSTASTANPSCLLNQNDTPSLTTSGLGQTSPTPASLSSLSQSHLYQLQQEQIRSLQEQLEMERQKRFELELHQELQLVRSSNRDDEDHHKQLQQQDPSSDVLDGYSTSITTLKMANGCDDHSISGGDGAGFHPIDISYVSSARSNNNNNNKQNAKWVYPADLLSNEKELFCSTSNGINNDRNSKGGVDKNDDANSLGNDSRQSMQMSLMMESIQDISLNDSAACSLKHCDSQTTMGSIDEIIAGNMVNGLSTAMSAISLMSMNDSTDSFIGSTSKFGGFNKGSLQNTPWKDVDLTNCGGPVINTSRIATIAGIDLKPLQRCSVTNPAA